MDGDRSFIAAAVTLRTGRDLKANVDHVVPLVERAIADGATYLQTPEMTSLIERDKASLMAQIGTEEDDAVVAALRDVARRRQVAVHVGSVAVKAGDKLANRALLIGPDGAIAARYDKIHLFDVDLPSGQSWRESRTYAGGQEAVLVEMPWGLLGLSICYDVRFPYLYRALASAGAEVLSAPACFTKETGEAHWSILLRARAIENGAFMIAAAQGGAHEDGRVTYGHSMIVDPWGRVLAEGTEEPGVMLATIDPSVVAAVRARIPSLQHTRQFRLGHARLAPAAQAAE
jgi:predicted amidohydrolase